VVYRRLSPICLLVAFYAPGALHEEPALCDRLIPIPVSRGSAPLPRAALRPACPAVCLPRTGKLLPARSETAGCPPLSVRHIPVLSGMA